jgi:hypothetical protein
MIPLLAVTAIVGGTIVNLDGWPQHTNAVLVIDGPLPTQGPRTTSEP